MIMVIIIYTFAILSILTVLPLAASTTSRTAIVNEDTKSHDVKNDNNSNSRHHHRRTQQIAPLNIFLLLKDQFDSHRSEIESFVFQTLRPFSTTQDTFDSTNNIYTNYKNDYKTLPSGVYTYDDFLRVLQSMVLEGTYGNSWHRESHPTVPSNTVGSNEYVNDESNTVFYLGDGDDDDDEMRMTLGLVNVCAFLANVMTMIQFDACDEFNGMMTGFDDDDNSNNSNYSNNNNGDKPMSLSELSAVNGRYFPLSNACGQNGLSYQDEDVECYIDNIDVSCKVDPLMDMRASIHPKYNYQSGKEEEEEQQNNISLFSRQPPPEFACGKKDYENDYTGYWDGYTAEFVQDVAYPNANGRIDVEGCCFWGRGALQTRGTCAIGKFNYYFGKRAYDENRPSRYPKVDFCKLPSVLCNTNVAQYGGVVYPELKWMVAFHHWIEGVQQYSGDESKWAYLPQLKVCDTISMHAFICFDTQHHQIMIDRVFSF